MSLAKSVNGERWRSIEDERLAGHGEVLEEIRFDDPEVQLHECRVAEVRHRDDVEENIKKRHLSQRMRAPLALSVMGKLFCACESITLIFTARDNAVHRAALSMR